MAGLDPFQAWTNADWLETIPVIGLAPEYQVAKLRARMEVRREASATTAILSASTFTGELRFVTDDEGLHLAIGISAARMAQVQPADHVRDVLILYGGSVIHSGFGAVVISQGVTRI
ncbi:hypothetical protein PMNALOAF_1260 [Methylobacterium adhaesivum]|uniref:Uncharacterized protein n=1 Tax=Methylobacterium adhaesivum TaxID=333297 RepID=A0ABT8BEP8_9HYPH|nr:hypothetical protein [Methylobacterium adhaesivum]MDN3590597.1 hypothetical protein [Methylobacterium adhaesivum]GJD30017.1 hypothetical protein PMNALOAF_1260 [Methylobacterium adhaesivum]